MQEKKQEAQRQKFSVFIITKNEELRIERCLSYLHAADEIVIVDGESTDHTRELALAYKKKHQLPIHFFTRAFTRFDEQKNAAIAHCSNDWVLDVDADEVVTPELMQEILETLKHVEDDVSGFFIPRKEFFLNQYLYHVPLVRLYRKSKASYTGMVHEMLQVSGKLSNLKHEMIHENYLHTHDQINTYVKKADFYSTLEARQLFVMHPHRSVGYILLRGFFQSTKMLFGLLLYKRLLLKGLPGMIWSVLSAYTELLVMMKWYELADKK